ncbi:L-lactate MFS transporter [Lacticaseibacillus jixiensis]|uniref:L-lactate MFS transporter n=1 Tax=Lacticaseibacillus jixiensis TaxID=3231926 RepID=UPI0036F3927B
MRINRYVVASAGIIFHLMIGSVYAWSVYTQEIHAQTHWNESAITFAFSLAILFLGTSAAFAGKLVERFGPRVTGTIASFCYGSGTVLTGVAIASHQLWLLYLAYGVLGGLGLGFGYVTPVSTIIKWFPKHRGIATGCAIMGFGFAAMLTSPVARMLMDHIGVVATFYSLGAGYFAVMLLCAQFIRPPKHAAQTSADHAGVNLMGGQALTANQAVKTREFAMLWLMLFINITCGIGLVAAASPMAQSQTAMTPGTAALMVGIIGVFNGLGRLLWASASDYLGRPNTFSVVFLVMGSLMLALLVIHTPVLFMIAMCVILSGYGAGFSVVPAYLSDVFGTKELGAIHGYVLTAWGAAGMVGPLVLSFTHQLTGSYTITLIVFAVLEAIALTMSVVIRKAFIPAGQTSEN